jgi:CDP-diacylglycerol--serine O-phosphatidyltransferase
LWPLNRLGWAAGFVYLTAAAMRLARFNIQTASAIDKRYFVGMPSPAAAGVIASTIYLFPEGPQDRQMALAALVMVVVPAMKMVSTIRFRSVKALDVGWHRSYFALFFVAVMLALIASHPRIALVTLAYSYTVGAIIAWAVGRVRRRPADAAAGELSASEITPTEGGL